MLDDSWSRDHPWFGGFVFAVLSAFVGVVAMVVAVADATGGNGTVPAQPTPGDSTETPSPADDETPDPSNTLSYDGPLPSALAGLGLREAGPGETADVRFRQSTTQGVPAEMGVVVTDPASGVYRINAEQAEGLLTGAISNWADVGGADRPVRVAAVGETPTGWPAHAEPERFETYDDLREALVAGSGIITLVPLSEVRSPMSSIAIGDQDPVRGTADVNTWPYVTRISVEGQSDRGRAAVIGFEEEMVGRLVRTAVTVVGTGDIIPVRCSLARIEDTGDWGSPFRGEVGQFLRDADLALGSLDTSFQDFSEPNRCIDTVNLTAPVAAVEVLTTAGIDLVTIATNHIMDCGQVGFCGLDAFQSTLDVLEANDIAYVGGGQNLDEALAPHIFEVDGITFGIVGFDDVAAMDLQATEDSPGTSPLDDSYADERETGGAAFFAPPEMLDLERYTSVIAAVDEQVDFTIVQLNSGTEDTHDPSGRSIKAARAAIEAGADIVHGNQAHHVQASESIGDSFIIYAMGNFIYDQLHTPEHTECVLLESVFWPDRLATVTLHPCVVVDQHRPEFVDQERRAKILGDIATAAANLPE